MQGRTFFLDPESIYMVQRGPDSGLWKRIIRCFFSSKLISMRPPDGSPETFEKPDFATWDLEILLHKISPKSSWPPEPQKVNIWSSCFCKSGLEFKDLLLVLYNFFKFISQITEILSATRCAVFCLSIGARVNRGLALSQPCKAARGLEAQHYLYD